MATKQQTLGAYSKAKKKTRTKSARPSKKKARKKRAAPMVST